LFAERLQMIFRLILQYKKERLNKKRPLTNVGGQKFNVIFYFVNSYTVVTVEFVVL
jgi:hypothetical protein